MSRFAAWLAPAAMSNASAKLRNRNSSEQLGADIDAARRIMRRAQAVRGDAGQDRLHVLGDHLVAALEHGPGAGGVNDGERGGRRQASDVIGRAPPVLEARLPVVEQP